MEGKVHGVRVNFLVNSGGAVMLMRNDTWERISAYKTSGLVGVEGSSLVIHGCITVNLHLGNCEIEIECCCSESVDYRCYNGCRFP